MLEKSDISSVLAHGLDEHAVEAQLARFREGFPFLGVVAPASVGNGILRLDESRIASLGGVFGASCGGVRVVKFVPASGAATRMFKDLFEFVASGVPNKIADEVLAQVDQFAFAAPLRETLHGDVSPAGVIAHLIGSEGLGYGEKPKALILFHRYADELRTALEEHLVEGARYAACNGRVSIHFTVSPEHADGFEQLLAAVLPKYEARFGVRYDISTSVQKSSTDTIAVNTDNTPFRSADGTLLFRPAGHGALIENLNDLDADLVFVKNIDNVTTDSRREDTIKYKKAIAGLLLEIREQVFGYLRQLDSGAAVVVEATDFVRQTLHVGLPASFDALDAGKKAEFLRKVLDRPLRVCGMVRNEGEPGGGPFFALNADGTTSLQIVESSQIAPDKRELMRSSTHFNPVDLVCSLRDHKGGKFDLTRYVDHATGFISEKSKDGRVLKAQELPGLWNGSMSDWNTIFVEVPVTTFTPVKVVTDLLRPEHRN